MHIEWNMARFMWKCKSPDSRVGPELTRQYVCRHDEMAVHAGKHRRSFIDTHEELTTAIQLKLMEYVKSLLDPMDNGTKDTPACSQPSDPTSLPHGEGSGTKSGNKSGARDKYRQLETEDGWPVMPEVSEDDLKDSLEDLLRQYLTAQYSEPCPRFTRSPKLTMWNRTCIWKKERTTTI